MKYEKLSDFPLDGSDQTPAGGINPRAKNFEVLGDQLARLLIEQTGLLPNHQVLDIGCGTGRIAQALQKHLAPSGYHGFDIHEKFVGYCSDAYPSLKFDLFDVVNLEYNPKGKTAGSEFIFPYGDNSFDLAFAIAVFNHMFLPEVVNYIQQSARVVRPGGKFLATAFLLNEDSAEHINTISKGPLRFLYREQAQWFGHEGRPLCCVAHSEVIIRRAMLSSGLQLREPISYGAWRGSPVAVTGHDLLVATKIA